MNYSTWNCVDLHIHSKFSDKVKQNDYDGNEYTAVELLDKMREQSVNIFSVTDHNCFNKNLYDDLEIKINNEKYKDINYVLGVELDINDPDIHDEIFHCLCFFDTRDTKLVEKCINEFFDSKEFNFRNNNEIYPNVKKIFTVLSKNNIKNILLIPHFNNKTKGIPSAHAVEHLNYLCFNAYEDANNIKNIEKSLKIYLRDGFDNFPFAVFTDNHNLNRYPEDKEGNLCSKCFMLSNINHPFNSIKTAFEEPRLRISIDGVDEMRHIVNTNKYIQSININGSTIALSPYQNTIIGRFGSGKSLLLEKIKNGANHLQQSRYYSSLYNPNEVFKIKINDTIGDSLEEILNSSNDLVKYEFVQSEYYYIENRLEENKMKDLLDRLNINYNFPESVTFNFNQEELNGAFNNMLTNIKKTDVKNNLNYEKAFNDQTYYSINYNTLIYNNTSASEKLESFSSSIDDVIDLKIYNDFSLFNDSEIKKIDDLDIIIIKKKKMLNYFLNNDICDLIKNCIDNYTNSYIKNDEKTSLNTFKSNIISFLDSIKKFENESNKYEKTFNEKIYNKNKKEKIINVFDAYSISSSFNISDEYHSVIDKIIKSDCRSVNLFSSVIKTCYLHDENYFSNNRDFKYCLDKYSEYANNLFKKEKIAYDILKDNVSMLKKSAGEKSSLFIELLFKKIENDISMQKSIILILDQPEDNIDNNNIFYEITNKIRDIKLGYNNFQSIIVTHNANVGITADSENIIIASENILPDGKEFKYRTGCIEDPAYINEVCNILEGGKDAMIQRTVKYGINIIKKVNENEV